MTLNFALLNTILFLTTSISFSQDFTGRDIRDHMLIELSKQGMLPDEEFEGSPFLNETFVTGDVYSFNSKFAGIPLRYNIFNDNIEFKQNNVVYALIPEPRIKKVHLGGDVFLVEKHEVKGKLKFGFLTLLDSGKVILMSKKIVNFTEKQEPKALESASTPAKFTRAQDEYFYKIGKGDAMKIGNLKNFIGSFPDKQDELAQFAKKEKISAKKEADLIKFVKYYNSL